MRKGLLKSSLNVLIWKCTPELIFKAIESICSFLSTFQWQKMLLFCVQILFHQADEDVQMNRPMQQQKPLRNACITFNNLQYCIILYINVVSISGWICNVLVPYAYTHTPYLHSIQATDNRDTVSEREEAGGHDWKTFNTSEFEIYKVRVRNIFFSAQRQKDIEINSIRAWMRKSTNMRINICRMNSNVSKRIYVFTFTHIALLLEYCIDCEK